MYVCMGGDSIVGIATVLRAGRSGDLNPVGGENFRTCRDPSCGQTSLPYDGHWVFPGGKTAKALH